MLRSFIMLGLCLSPLTALIGCGPSAVSPEVTQQRERYLLREEPSGAVGVLDVREADSLPEQVILVGKIGGTASPWSPGQASFVITDPSAAAEGHDHCGDDCPFCKHKTDGKDAMALVQFKDQAGNILPIDARELFELEDADTVVVRGKPEINDLGLMVVAADAIYLRR